MSNKILNLIFKATDKASPTLDKLQGASGQSGVGGLTDSLKKMINPATLAMGAVTGLGVAATKMMEDWRESITAVSDFNAMIGGTMEETSKLIAISEDYNITQDTMLAAMRTMAQNGLEPTIESLEKLRLQYLAIKDPAEALAWAQTQVGEQGIKQILPMWDAINGSMVEYGENIDANRIRTDQDREDMLAYTKAVQELGYAFDAVKMDLTGWAAPGVTAFLELLDTPFSPDSAALFIRHFFGIGSAKGIDTTTRSMQDFVDVTKEAAGLEIEIPVEIEDPYAKLETLAQILRQWSKENKLAVEIESLRLGREEAAERPEDVPGGPGGGAETVIIVTKGGRIGGEKEGFQAGGSFKVGGAGGPDSQRVSFDASPGEQVNISKEDTMGELLLVMKRLPTTIADALERKL